MALRHAILATLLDREATGYQLAKAFDPEVSAYWHCTPQQVYLELARLEVAGMIIGRQVVQQRRPNKRIFSLAPAGRDELARFVLSETKPSFIRDDLLVKVLAFEAADPRGLVDQLHQRAALARQRIAEFDELLGQLRGSRSESEYVAAGEQIGRYLTAVRGRSFEQENLNWCVWVAQVIAARQT